MFGRNEYNWSVQIVDKPMKRWYFSCVVIHCGHQTNTIIVFQTARSLNAPQVFNKYIPFSSRDRRSNFTMAFWEKRACYRVQKIEQDIQTVTKQLITLSKNPETLRTNQWNSKLTLM